MDRKTEFKGRHLTELHSGFTSANHVLDFKEGTPNVF